MPPAMPRPAALAAPFVALLCGCATAGDLVVDGVRAACGESRGERHAPKRDDRGFEETFRDDFADREREARQADRRRRAAVPFDPDFTVGPPTA